MTAEISLRGSRGWPRYTTPSGVFRASPERSFRVAPARYARAACSVNHWLAVPAVEAASSCRGGTGDEMHKSRAQLETPGEASRLARSQRCGGRAARGPVGPMCALRYLSSLREGLPLLPRSTSNLVAFGRATRAR